jgi:hypothetical protein
MRELNANSAMYAEQNPNENLPLEEFEIAIFEGI